MIMYFGKGRWRRRNKKTQEVECEGCRVQAAARACFSVCSPGR